MEELQKATIEHLMIGSDVGLSVRIGAGKSRCYQAFLPMFNNVNQHNERTDYLSELRFTATYIGKDKKEKDSIKRGEYNFLFTSPEAVVGNPKWRAMLFGPAGERVRLLVIDEAHTILH